MEERRRGVGERRGRVAVVERKGMCVRGERKKLRLRHRKQGEAVGDREGKGVCVCVSKSL